MFDSWLLMAFVAPFLWAVANLIDVYFVGEVYEDEYDGTILSGVFQSFAFLPAVFGILHPEMPDMAVSALFVLSGFLFLSSLFFYFQSLFILDDAALIQTIWNTTILATPFFAWLLFAERLEPKHYLGIAIAFVGVWVLSISASFRFRTLKKILPSMAAAVALLSLSMVFSERAYGLSDTSFYSGFFLFSLGSVSGAAVAFLLDRKKRAKHRSKHVFSLGKKYFLVFCVAELLSVIGTLGSQRALDLAPSAAFVAVVESSIPFFIVLLSALMMAALYLFGRGAAARRIYREQLTGIGVKILSLIIIISGIYLIS